MSSAYGEARYTAQQVAKALFLTGARFEWLRNANLRLDQWIGRARFRLLTGSTNGGRPSARLKGAGAKIRATAGKGTRDQRWSAMDAVKLAVLLRASELGLKGPAARKRLFDSIPSDDVLAALAGQQRCLCIGPAKLEPWVFAVTGPDVVDSELRQRKINVACIINLTTIASEVLWHLDKVPVAV